MTLLAAIVGTSTQVAATAARSAKIRLLADVLRSLGAGELEIAVLYLSGEIRQGRIGIGPSALRTSIGGVAAEAALEILEVDRRLDELSGIRGSGSGMRRAVALRE